MNALKAGHQRSAHTAQTSLALALTLVIGLALYWGFLRDEKPPQTSGMRASMNFAAVPDGPVPPRFDTGQPTFVSQTRNDPGATFQVNNGCITFAPTSPDRAAAYLSTPNMDRSVTELGADIVFRRGGGTVGAAALVVSDGFDENQSPPLLSPLPIHFVITAHNWNLSVRKSSADELDVIQAGSIDPPLSEDGDQPFRVDLTITGGQLTLDISTGVHQIVKDPRIAEWAGNYASFESYANHGQTDSTACFREVWADSRGGDK